MGLRIVAVGDAFFRKPRSRHQLGYDERDESWRHLRRRAARERAASGGMREDRAGSRRQKRNEIGKRIGAAKTPTNE